jgi:hypothetical protein
VACLERSLRLAVRPAPAVPHAISPTRSDGNQRETRFGALATPFGCCRWDFTRTDSARRSKPGHHQTAIQSLNCYIRRAIAEAGVPSQQGHLEYSRRRAGVGRQGVQSGGLFARSRSTGSGKQDSVSAAEMADWSRTWQAVATSNWRSNVPGARKGS